MLTWALLLFAVSLWVLGASLYLLHRAGRLCQSVALVLVDLRETTYPERRSES